MSFIQPCFIRKVSKEIIKRLEELGYRLICDCSPEDYGLYVFDGKIQPIFDNSDNLIKIWKLENAIDCKDSEFVFIFIAALRDDTDDNQLFINEKGDCVFFIKRPVNKT